MASPPFRVHLTPSPHRHRPWPGDLARRRAGARLRHDRPLHRPPPHRRRGGARGDGDGLAGGRPHARRHERAARGTRPPCPWHDAGEACRMRFAPQCAGNRLRLFQDAGAQDARQPGPCDERKGRSIAARCDAATAVAFGFDEIETTMRVSRNAWSNAMACAVGLPSAAGARCSSAPARRRRNSGSAWRASPPMPRRSPSTARRRASPMATTRHGPSLPCCGLCLARHQDALHQRGRGGTADASTRAKSLLYLEARCLCLQRGMGRSGARRIGGIDARRSPPPCPAASAN